MVLRPALQPLMIRLALGAVTLGAATAAAPGLAIAGPGLPRHYQFMVGQDQPGQDGGVWTAVVVGPDQSFYLTAGDRVLRFGPEGDLVNAWGGPGDQPGQFRGPGPIAVAADATVYVADRGNSRIQRFTAWGAYLEHWGRGGDGPDSLSSISGMAIGPHGRIYVADAARYRIKIFAASGDYLGSFPASDPRDVAVSADGRIYVAEYAASRLGVYDKQGRWIDGYPFSYCEQGVLIGVSYACAPSWLTLAPDGSIYAQGPWSWLVHLSPTLKALPLPDTIRTNADYAPKIGVRKDLSVIVGGREDLKLFSESGAYLGGISGELRSATGFAAPTDVDVAKDGAIYVVDATSHRLSMLSPDGRLQWRVGGNGWGPGLLHEPSAVLVLDDDSILVADSGNARLVRFDRQGRWLGTVSVPGGLERPVGLARQPDGRVAVADRVAGRIVVIDPRGGGVIWSTPKGLLRDVVDLAATADGRLLAALVTPPGSYGKVVAVGPDAVVSPWGDGSMIGKPAGIAIRGDDVFVAEHNLADPDASHAGVAVQRFNLAGTFRSRIALGGCGPGRLGEPRGIAFQPDGHLLVADAKRRDLLRMDLDGAGMTSVDGLPSGGSGRMDRPSAVGAGAGTVFAVDSAEGRIQSLGPDGELGAQWRPSGCGDERLQGPTDAAVAADGSLFVADASSHRILRYGPQGQALGAWGSPSGSRPALAGIRDLATLSDGGFMVAEAAGRRVSRFDADGNWRASWGSSGSGPGQFGGELEWSVSCRASPPSPSAIAGDQDGTVLVADPGNHRVQRFNLDGTFISAFEPDGPPTIGRIDPIHLAIGPDRTIYVGGWDRARSWAFLTAYTPEGQFLRELGRFDRSNKGLCFSALLISRTQRLYAAFGRLELSGRTTGLVEVMDSSGQGLGTWHQGRKDDRHFYPVDLAEQVDGTILVVDKVDRGPNLQGPAAVMRLSPDGEMLGTWSPGTPNGASGPIVWGGADLQVAVRADGGAYLTNGGRNQVVRLAADATPQRSWRSILHGPGRFESPTGVAVVKGPSGEELVYVAEQGEAAIDVFNLAGGFVRRFGGFQQLGGLTFRGLGGLGAGPDGSLLITEVTERQVRVMDQDGSTRLILGQGGEGEGSLKSPRDVAARSDGLIVVADADRRKLVAFGPDGQGLGDWDGGAGLRQPLAEPVSLAFSGSRLWVVDRAERRLLAFDEAPPLAWHLRSYRDRGLLDGPWHVQSMGQPVLDFGTGAPSAALPADGFSLRLERPVPTTGRYRVNASVTGRATLDLGAGHLGLPSTDHPARVEADLHAGQSIRLDYMDPGGVAGLRIDALRIEQTLCLPWVRGD